MSDPAGPSRADGDLLRAGNLSCGADVDTLLEQIADSDGDQLTAHQRDCVYCRAAIIELTAAWAPVRELAATPVPAPGALTEQVMGRIRRLVHDVGYTLQITDGGAIRIAARIVIALARDSASRVPGVRLALGRTSRGMLGASAQDALLRRRRGQADVGVLGSTAVVDLAVAVNYDRPIHDVARDIQRQVAAVLHHNLGLQTVTVNVSVDDILDGSTD